jgi:hypothetical protein
MEKTLPLNLPERVSTWNRCSPCFTGPGFGVIFAIAMTAFCVLLAAAPMADITKKPDSRRDSAKPHPLPERKTLTLKNLAFRYKA